MALLGTSRVVVHNLQDVCETLGVSSDAVKELILEGLDATSEITSDTLVIKGRYTTDQISLVLGCNVSTTGVCF